jgi:hypothetical protein
MMIGYDICDCFTMEHFQLRQRMTLTTKIYCSRLYVKTLSDNNPPPPGGTAILPEYIHYYGYYYQVIVSVNQHNYQRLASTF